MEPLLFLAHRLPYPPTKGDKVRSYHLLNHLASAYRVFLGTFIDDPADWQYVQKLRCICEEVHVEALKPWAGRAKSLRAFLSGEALSVPYFRSSRFSAWTRQTVQRQGITRALAFSSPMAQYALPLNVECFVDFVDLDSAKWAEYAARRPWPASAVYGLEAQRLLAYERRVALRAQASIFVTEDEAQRFRASAPESAHRVRVIRNGVDAGYFSSQHALDSPYTEKGPTIVFTGAMDYWPNIDAVVWFAREVLPLIRKQHPSTRFYIVGMNPAAAVRALAHDPAVTVTGRVHDVRPYLRHAAAVVAPLRVARGIQNKVLEAMAMGKPVVTTPACAAALTAQRGIDLEVAADAEAFAAATAAIIDSERGRQIAERARQRIVRDYEWATSFGQLDRLLRPSTCAVDKVAAQ